MLARADPELAVLSVMAHGRDEDTSKAAKIAAAAQTAAHDLDDERSGLYLDLILTSLSEVARKESQSMDPAKYEYQSDFARRYVAQGRAAGREEGRAEGREEGRAEGRAALLEKQLTARFGFLPEDIKTRIATASIDELDAIGERLLSAKTLEEAVY